MGRGLGELFTALDVELTWVFVRWIQFRKLYVVKPSHLETLNRTASFFFWVVQQVLFEDTILGISRLAGPEKSAGKPNLALRRVIALVPDASLRESLEHHIAGLDEATRFATAWRNRHIAHRDLDLALGKEAAPLPPAEVSHIDDVLDKMAAILNTVSRHYFRSETGYRLAAPVQDAEDLMYYLRAGVRREDIRNQRLLNGEYNPDDWDEVDRPT